MKRNQGFALVELIVVMVIAGTLFGLTMINLIRTQKTSEVNAIADTLITDMASQQTKAMLGLGTSSGTDYGIHFESDRYVLFKGSTYSVSDSQNQTINIDSGYSIKNILFPGSNIIFINTTGTVSGFLNGSNSVTLGDNEQAKSITVTVNRYGVVTGEN